MDASYVEGHRFRGKVSEMGNSYSVEVVVDEAPPMGYGYAAKAVEIEEQKRNKPRKMMSIGYIGPMAMALVNHVKSGPASPINPNQQRHRNVDLGE